MSKQGIWLKQAREAAGLRNKDVCEKLGISSGRLSMIESGSAQANGQLQTLCDLYGISAEDAPIVRKRASKPVINTELDTYIQIAQLAARVGNTEIAMTALAEMENAK